MTSGTPLLTAIGQSVEVLGAPTGTLLDPSTVHAGQAGNVECRISS